MSLDNLIVLENEEQWDELYNSDKKLVLDFTATWCGPCKLLTPVIKLLCEKFPNLTFVKIDVDEFDELVTTRNISCMPTVQFVHNKETKNTVEGLDVDTIVNLVNQFN